MKEEPKNRWMVWAIVVLAIMNLTTLFTILYHNSKSEEAEYVSAPGKIMSDSTSVKYSGRYFRDQLNLSREQMNRFVEFNPVFRQQARNVNINMERIRKQMLLEMAAKNSDKNKLDNLSDSIGYLHAKLKKLTYMYYLNIKSMCDQQQQKNLEQLFGEMFTSEMPVGQNGKGSPNGRRYGRRLNN